MNLRDFCIGWRLLANEPVYSLVVVFGLALGFAACFLLLGFVRYSFNYDAQVPDKERVYFVKESMTLFSPPFWSNSAKLPLSDVIKKSGQAVATSFVYPIYSVVQVGNVSRKIKLSSVETDFPQIFGIQALEGDLPSALTQPDAIALTMSTAQKIFGDNQALHKTVKIAENLYRVTALLPDPPSNTAQPYEALVGKNTSAWPEVERAKALHDWDNTSSQIYMKLSPHTSPEVLEKMLQKEIDKFGFGRSFKPEELLKLRGGKAIEVRLVALPDGYFDQDLMSDDGEHANKKIVIGLAAVAILILLLAAINYVNLAIVRTLRRQREIGLRKLLGASVNRLVGHFLAEAMLVSMIATALGMLLAWLLLPLFSELMVRKLDTLFTLQNLVFSALFGIIVGLLTGAYPAWIALRVSVSESVAGRGNSETSSGLWLRRILTIMQFSVAMGFTGLTLAIVWQAHYASKINLGFDPEKLVVIDLPDSLINPIDVMFRDKLAHLPGVSEVAASADYPGSPRTKCMNRSHNNAGEPVEMSCQPVSVNFFDVYGVKPLAGRLFNSHIDQVEHSNVVVVNWLAAKALGFHSPEEAIGQIFPVDDNKIIGVVPYIRHQNLRETVQPNYYRLSNALRVLTVRTNGDFDALEKAVTALWVQTFPTDTLRMRRLSDAIAINYADDLRMAKLLAASSLLAIAIAAFGIYVLSAYSVQRRTREIVLRKLYGANGGAIARLLAREYGVLVAISALIGLPIAFVASAKYLAEFVEHAPMGVWPLVGALFVACMVAFVSVLRHALLAIRMPPADALHN
ncbi:ABC transporter permease [Solimicrobium silvestre]|uniref:FtsX-like permease family n=1 Tax=Solimicrobium silvestre TaxID=2099400 RepID=A0A2S9H4T1_9BURK|nr:ABC transporter permease [Solimicrobium silvestre]PRC94951.1 FtsX-like permease family [Solimicrobium silvestre]